jgi:hypothetical protein
MVIIVLDRAEALKRYCGALQETVTTLASAAPLA